LNRPVKGPIHINIRPADPSITHGNHITSNVNIHALYRLADLLSVIDQLIVGTSESALAPHGDKLACWVSDFLPCHKCIAAVESGDVSIGAVGCASCDPVDLAITVSDELRSCFVTDQSILVRELSDCDVAVIGAIDRVGESCSKPVVGCKILSTSRHPSKYVSIAVNKPCEATIRAGHATHSLIASAVCDILIGDLDAVHRLCLSIQPNSTLVLSADTREWHRVRSLERDTGVVAAAPAGASALNGLECAVFGHVLNAITEVACC
jgi:hypothetical protein